MPAYSFKERFIPLIRSGAKKQTIRKKRKGQARYGDILYFYYGMRTKFCTKIGEATCLGVKGITIYLNGAIKLSGDLLSKQQRDQLAIQDGFKDSEEMLEWWRKTNGLPFFGDLILWDDFKPAL